MGFKTTKAVIPFAETVRQDVQLNYTPHHDLLTEEYERFDRSYFATWNEENDFNESKSVEDLPIDEEFGAILRIMVKQLGTSNSQEDVYITVDCNQENMNTSLWFCKNKQQIFGAKICDGEKDCVDESDENPDLCFGTNMKLIVIVKSVSISVLIFGYMAFVALFIGSKNVSKSKIPNNDEFSKEDIDCCKLVFTVCRDVATRNDVISEDEADVNEFKPIVEKYKSLQDSGNFQQMTFLHRCIKNVALNESLTLTCMKLSSVLISMDRIKSQEDRNQPNQKMKKMLSTNWPTANFMIESEERTGFVSKTVVFCKSLLPQILARNIGFVFSID